MLIQSSPSKKTLRFVTVSITTLFILLFYHNVLFNLDNYIFGIDGDGLKNYYFVKYYINDAAALHNQFNGMNYPFGENLNYLDAQPLTTCIFKWINLNVVNTGDTFVSTTYLLFFISIILTGNLLLEIFFEYGITNWFAVLFACSITLLSPQIQRITFHVYLSYTFVLPAAWLLFLKFRKHRKFKQAFALNSLIIMTGFLHPYYTPLCALLIFLLTVFDNEFKGVEKLKYIFAFCLLPLFIFKLLLILGYHGAEDFAQHPYGAFGEAYRSRPEDVFLPNAMSSWGQWFNLRWIAHASYEGEAFLGWALSLTGIVFILYMIVKSIIKKSFSEFNPFKTNTGLLFSVVIVFIFSAGTLHFILPRNVQDSVPAFITQFRTYGRLAWIAYYLLAVFFSIIFYRFYEWLDASKWKAKILLSMFVIICLADIIETNMRVLNSFEKADKDNTDSSIFSLCNNIDAKNYQAIISLPYFHLISGVDNSREPQPGQLWPALKLSLKTGLPLTDTYVSRTSQQNAKKQIAFYSGNDKSVLENYNSKELLIIVSQQDSLRIMNRTINLSELYPKEIELLAKAKFLNRSGDLLLYEISINDLKNY